MGGNTAAIIGGAVNVGAGIATMVGAAQQKEDAEVEAEIKREALKALQNSRQEIVNPYESVTNQYANLGVATQAAEFQAEEADIALANTLDTLRASGYGAGGATALAMAAAKSKKEVSASIETQEVNNQKLRAEGQMKVDELKAKGEDTKWLRQEERDLVDLDRTQTQLDNANAQTAASNAAMWGALGNIGSAAMSTGFNMNEFGQKSTDTPVDPKTTPTTPTTSTTPTYNAQGQPTTPSYGTGNAGGGPGHTPGPGGVYTVPTACAQGQVWNATLGMCI